MHLHSAQKQKLVIYSICGTPKTRHIATPATRLDVPRFDASERNPASNIKPQLRVSWTYPVLDTVDESSPCSVAIRGKNWITVVNAPISILYCKVLPQPDYNVPKLKPIDKNPKPACEAFSLPFVSPLCVNNRQKIWIECARLII